MDILRICMRLQLLWIPPICTDLYMLNLFLGRRRSLIPAAAYLYIKMTLVNTIMIQVLNPIYRGNQWYDNFYFCIVLITTVMTYFVFNWTFRGGFLKVSLFTMLSEWNYTAFGLGFVAILNYFEGHPGLYYYYNSEVHVLDLLLIPYTILILWIETKCFRSLAFRIRGWKPKRKGFLWIAAVFYMCLAVWSLMEGVVDDVAVVHSLLAVGIIGAAVLLFWKEKSKAEKMSAFLNKQQELMILHYGQISVQIADMERNQKVIEEQMQQVEKMYAGEISFSGKALSEYLKQLSSSYNRIRAGIYCDDFMIDAALYYMAEICKSRKIRCSFAFRNYDRGKIEERDLARILFILLDCGIREHIENENTEGFAAPKLCLEAGTVKNQLIIHFSGPELKNTRKLKRLLQDELGRYHGYIQEQKKSKKEYEMFLKLDRE